MTKYECVFNLSGSSGQSSVLLSTTQWTSPSSATPAAFKQLEHWPEELHDACGQFDLHSKRWCMYVHGSFLPSANKRKHHKRCCSIRFNEQLLSLYWVMPLCICNCTNPWTTSLPRWFSRLYRRNKKKINTCIVATSTPRWTNPAKHCSRNKNHVFVQCMIFR